ncbi:phosphate-starvation-inducible PsiE family protein [Catalinimonas sp. 4WD22]|uniref:phosphate-starvation-inducible PsiE family protein n=1 Tax=Catalinimonas locisalis TaxID=3133978 RepID=UPI003101917E
MIHKVTTYIQFFLIGVIFLYIAVEIFELCLSLYAMISTLEEGERLLFSREESSNMLVIFFSILIGIELVDTLLPRNDKEIDRVMLILLISLIALGRKFITVDYKHADPMLLFSLSAVTLALAIAYYILKKSSALKDK